MIEVDDNVISLTRGDSAAFVLDLEDENGDPYVPNPGDVIRFAMSKTYGVDEPLIRKEVDHETMQVELEPEDTKHLAFGNYVYDIELTDESGHVTTILLSKLKLTKEVY